MQGRYLEIPSSKTELGRHQQRQRIPAPALQLELLGGRLLQQRGDEGGRRGRLWSRGVTTHPISIVMWLPKYIIMILSHEYKIKNLYLMLYLMLVSFIQGDNSGPWQTLDLEPVWLTLDLDKVFVADQNCRPLYSCSALPCALYFIKYS